MANKPTIFQKLTNVLTADAKGEIKSQKFSLKNNEILKTNSKKDFESAKLEAQQNKYLNNVWKKVENGLVQQSINYETTRIGSYADFESMEYYPLIGAALDIMAEESCTLNANGRMINVYSDSKRIKGIIEDLLYNRLDIHTSLPMWTRAVCKYGDNFLLLKLDAKQGVTAAKQLPTYEMERREGGLYDSIMNGQGATNLTQSNKVKFYWRTNDIEFNSLQIAHFRLLGDDRRLPYGTSLLEKARRIWKQIILSEDSMLVYRVTRAPERRVFKIYVGNIDANDVPAYVDSIANKFKRTSVVDPQTGQLDLRYNQLSNDQDIFVPVRTENAPNPIDTLPGAANLNDIADINYLQSQLFTALRVPKPFLGYDEATGDGKNLALQDIRFSRTVNRVQQSMLQELNKIVIIHLFLLGFEDDLDNFTLTLNNPSTQAEMLKTEHQQVKVTLYKDTVSDAGNGFGATSMTRAKREIFGWSDDEIKQDLLEQRMEKAAAAELENTSKIIKHTGMFDTVDRIYGDYDLALKGGGGSAEGEEGAEGGGSGGLGGGFGGGGLGGEDLDFSEDGEDDKGAEDGEGGEFGGNEPNGGEDAGDDAGGEPGPEPTGTETQEPKTTNESIETALNILTERKEHLKKDYTEKKERYKKRYMDRLIDSVSNKKTIQESKNIVAKTFNLNKGIDSMITNINQMLNE
jgi:hypothetical protein